MTKAQLFFCRSLAMSCLTLPANVATAQALKWSPPALYAQGEETALAAHPSGLVLEAHRTIDSGGYALWYHIGALNGMGVTWGERQRPPWEGTWPNVAISKEGYVIFVYSSGKFKSSSYLQYAVGMIDPNGGLDQSITWFTPTSVRFDSGFHSSTAINDNGVILDVHESGSGGTGLYYRVGHLTNPAGGDFTIEWDSGTNGVRYDDGINPHIALNNHNQIIEVHQVTGEHYVHYRRGTVSGGKISFGRSLRYDNHSYEPSVAVLDYGGVVELHRGAENSISSRTGLLNPDSTDEIIWFNANVLSNGSSDKADNPAVTTNGTYAIGTWESLRPDHTSAHLFSSAAYAAPFQSEFLEPQGVFQAERQFPVRVSPRRIRQKANNPPPAPRTVFRSKSESSGSARPAGNHGKVNDRSSAPPKAVLSKSVAPGRSASPEGTSGKAKDRRSGRAITP
jgi:hypothetical protein